MELRDAIITQTSMSGQVLLRWGWTDLSFPSHSVQLPKAVAEEIIAWRNKALEEEEK